ncbi:wd40 repeat-like protein [Neofusicoccum parvum]|uniref:Wd40 repeat-like protein n=1 Tax=Neofusicoccum parvum TaxID=310453 RepID=A0ACB5S3Q1_9PEZI|nr:wd40 repeat-like protein [Neofusicoccum parvum]
MAAASPRRSDAQRPHPERPPAQPAYVLRGHAAQVHAARFVRHNSRLLTGDADGWVVLWDIATKRAVAVWHAHEGAVLGFGTWGEDNIISHGRDFHLRVWQLSPADESTFSTALPVDDTTADRKQPWLLHSLKVNTLNFCSFAMCPEPPASPDATSTSILIAVPSTKDDEVDIFQLPSERRVSSVPNLGRKTGMTMALSLIVCPSTPTPLHCISAYECGAVAVHAFNTSAHTWTPIYTSQPHTQPILSLSPSPTPSQTLEFFTSGADDLIAKHTVPLSSLPPPSPSAPPTPTTHPAPPPSSDANPKSLLTAALTSHPPHGSPALPPPQPNPAPATPVKATHTKHSGQQSVTVRSDGRILATAGWDGRVRVYSARSVREVAVLAWHKEGCYAVAFADVGAAEGGDEGEGVIDQEN